jgi:hypothetical protein
MNQEAVFWDLLMIFAIAGLSLPDPTWALKLF